MSDPNKSTSTGGTSTTEWPPAVRGEGQVPRKLGAWKFTSDGPFWGGLLTFLIFVSVIAYLTAAICEGRR